MIKSNKKPTIYDIKHSLRLEKKDSLGRVSLEPSPFFDRKTLKFFGQTMLSFSVHRTENPNIFKVLGSSDYFMGSKQHFESTHYFEAVKKTNESNGVEFVDYYRHFRRY